MSKQKKGGKAQHSGEASNAQQRLEAVVLADSFDVMQRPISLDLPRALFPLANVPLIEYTLEFLASNEVANVYMVCCAHAEKIKGYIERSKWGQDGSSMKVQVIVAMKVHLLYFRNFIKLIEVINSLSFRLYRQVMLCVTCTRKASFETTSFLSMVMSWQPLSLHQSFELTNKLELLIKK